MLRCLTSKATQRLLYQLQELDLFKAQVGGGRGGCAGGSVASAERLRWRVRSLGSDRTAPGPAARPAALLRARAPTRAARTCPPSPALRWLQNYVSTHPPSEGNKFQLELFSQPASEVYDATNATTHKIEPANLAHRIIEIRSSMGQAMAKFPK